MKDPLVMGSNEVTIELSGLLGRKLVAYIASVNTVAIVRTLENATSYSNGEVAYRLRVALRYARLLTESEGKHIAQTWFQGLKHDLPGEISPANWLRNGPVEKLEYELAGTYLSYITGSYA